MPLTDTGTWKVGHQYYWFREYSDGRQEYQFDPTTGEETLWGPSTPSDIIRAGWIPMTEELATKIANYNEFGYAVRDTPHVVELGPDQKLMLYRDCSLVRGLNVTCKACGYTWNSKVEPEVCSGCGVSPESVSLDASGRVLNPFVLSATMWDDSVYILGVEGKFQMKFGREGLTSRAL